MFVSNLTIENWVGNKDESTVIENPSWQEIETAILELNGKSKTLVTLGADEESYMSIGGGEAGKYIVNVTFDNISFYNLVNFSKSEQIEKLVVGGQVGDYPEKMCINLQTVLLASKTFAELGKLEESVIWEEEKTFVML
ncbi:Imm1 family immunity protein [Floridanema aerugineum]|uniref:Imm1 family immunity protein n=1 Tax=Floridaenema aerugineum BLCC-F46 TaxID=3153654 RepID=A0ABV4XEQ9_9CYAN